MTINSFCIVGQIDELPVLKEVGKGIKQATLTLKVARPFRDIDGSYKYDYIPVQVWRGLAETICQGSSLENWISVRGRIATSSYTYNGKNCSSYSFIAESIDFIH